MALTLRKVWTSLSGLGAASLMVSVLRAAPGSTPGAALPVPPEVPAAAKRVRARGLTPGIASETLRSHAARIS